MPSRALMALSSGIVLLLGVLHFLYTLRGPKLTPRDPDLQRRMAEVSPVITKETSMWRCWVGFNVSHSMGLIFFGVVFGYLAIAHPHLLFQSRFLLGVGLATLIGYVILAKLYLFSVPFACLAVSLMSYVVSIVMAARGTQ
jgi:hypothetical protein